MNTLPIPANSLEFVAASKLPASLRQLTANEAIHAKSLLPQFAEWLKGTKQRAGIQGAEVNEISLHDLNTLFPYMVSYYPTPNGYLVTTRRAVAANPKVPGIQARELDPASCWVGPTPAAALLAMMTERINNKEMRHNRAGSMVVERAALAAV